MRPGGSLEPYGTSNDLVGHCLNRPEALRCSSSWLGTNRLRPLGKADHGHALRDGPCGSGGIDFHLQTLN